HKAATLDKTQTAAKIILVRFKVTFVLYLSPNNRARSLSTVMAVIVPKDTPHNAASLVYLQRFQCSLAIDIQ
ncbi:hypothetical protein pdam_00017414, partial [Pocillopora damicornis]